MYPSSAVRTFSLVILGAIIFFFRSGALPFLGADEPRYTRIAEEMRTSGDWVLPRLEGKPWLEKPPLFYWLAALSFSLFGSGEAQARLVSAASIALLVAAIYYFGKRWFSVQTGWIGALIFISSSAATGFSRAASMDAPFSCLVFLGVCCFGQAVLEEKKPAQILFTVMSAVFLGLSVLAKGLLGIVLPAIVILFFLIWTETWRRLSWYLAFLWVGIILAVSIPWHWMAFQRDGFEFLAVYLINHHLARFFTEIHHHTQPIYYYLVILPAGLLPWTPLLAILAVRVRQSIDRGPIRSRSQSQAGLLMALMVLFLLGFFSLSSSKLPGYILPACPPLALLIAARWAEWERSPAIILWTRRLLILTAFLVLFLGPVFSFLLLRFYGLSWPAAVACGSSYLLGGVLLLYRLRKKPNSGGYSDAFLLLAFTHALLVAQLSLWAFSPIGQRHSTRDLAQEVRRQGTADEPFFSYRSFHHTLSYYAEGRWQGILERPEDLGRQVVRNADKSILLMTEERWIDEVQRASRRRLERLGQFGPRILIRLLP